MCILKCFSGLKCVRTSSTAFFFSPLYQPSVPNLKQIIMSKWHLFKKQPLLNEILKEPPLISYKKGRSLKDMFVRAKL